MNETFDDLIKMARDRRASDVHIGAGACPAARIDGDIVNLTDEKMMPDRINAMLDTVITEKRDFDHLKEEGELDMPYSIPGVARLRVNVYRQRGSYAVAARLLHSRGCCEDVRQKTGPDTLHRAYGLRQVHVPGLSDRCREREVPPPHHHAGGPHRVPAPPQVLHRPPAGDRLRHEVLRQRPPGRPPRGPGRDPDRRDA